jgi:hypothetical protein
MILALILLLGILSSFYKGRSTSYRRGIVLFIVLGSVIVSVVALMNSFYPDGFTDQILSLSPDYYNTIGAPARTWPKYREEQGYNIAVLGNVGNVSANDKEVVEGPFKKRLTALMAGKSE